MVIFPIKGVAGWFKNIAPADRYLLTYLPSFTVRMPFLHPPISAVVSRLEWVPVSYNFSTKGGFGLVFKRVVMGNSKSRFVIFTYTYIPLIKQSEWFIPFRTSTHVKFTQRPSPFEGLTAVLFRFEQEKFDWAALRHLDCIQWLISGSGGLGLLITVRSLCQNPKRNESPKHHFSGNMVVFVCVCVSTGCFL